jgi:hypothetical protein
MDKAKGRTQRIIIYIGRAESGIGALPYGD